MSLSIQKISKNFGKHTVLLDLELQLNKGEILGLLGKNGAGKTTLLKILAGINYPDRGVIPGREALRIGYLSEKNALYPNMYPLEYLQLAANIQGDYDPNRISELIEELELTDVIDKKIAQLSKGYRQRLGIAGVLAHDPDLIILDEPVNGLDPFQIKLYRNLIKKHAVNKYIILSSHLMQEIEAICDRVAILENGKIQSIKNLDSALHEGSTKRFYLKTDKPIDLELFKLFPLMKSPKLLGATELEFNIADILENRISLFDFLVKENHRILEFRPKSVDIKDLFNE